MVNRHRGETALMVEGEALPLRLTLGALAELEHAFAVDSLPALGHARATQRVVCAFGHGHLGLTQSAGTARLVADLLTDRRPAIDLTPFSPQRF